jgi:O-antigen ligase
VNPVPRQFQSVLTLAAVLLVAWGAFAFGAVYPWAYTSLGAGATIVGIAALTSMRRARPPLALIATALAAVGATIAMQLVPLPRQTLVAISPHVNQFQERYVADYGRLQAPDLESASDGALTVSKPLSIAPTRSATGLGLFVVFSVFFLGLSRLFSRTGAMNIVRLLIVTGILLSIVGIAQDALTAHQARPLVYGFWKPVFDARPFGPFINPNHFAGWMLMVLPLSLALFYETLQKMLGAVAASRSNRVSIAGLPEFGLMLTYGFASLVMGLSLVLTRSRSGIVTLAAGSMLALWMVIKRQSTITSRLVAVAAFVALLGGAAAWAGLDPIVGKALGTGANTDSLGGRLGAWSDTLQIIRDFPLTGCGWNTYGVAMTVYQTANRSVHFQEAHNDYLQIAAEGGLLVGVPALVVLGIFVVQVRRRFVEAPKVGTTYWLRVGAVIGLISIGLQSLMEFSLQMPGNAALFAMLAAIAIHQSPNLRSGPSTRSYKHGYADHRSGTIVGAI